MVSAAPVRSIAEWTGRAREVAATLAETAAYFDRTAEFPFENFKALRAAGLLNVTVPTRFGGDGAGLEAACAVVGEIARGEPSTALVLAMQYIYHRVAEAAGWGATVHEQLCRESVKGIALINVMRAEPELGTPARGGLPATTATPTENGWSISGHKLYATGSPILSYFIVWGRTAGDDPQVGWFVVPNGAPGVRIVGTWDHLGMRATGSHDLILEGAEIPREHAVDIRGPSRWGVGDPVQSAWNNLVLAALYNGIAVAARDWLTAYLHERVPSNLGASLATLPRMQAAVGEIQALLFSNGELLQALAREGDAGNLNPGFAARTSIAKYVMTNNAIKAVDIALGLVGNPGLSRHNDLERHHRDVLCGRIHVPQDDMVVLMAGKAALGV